VADTLKIHLGQNQHKCTEDEGNQKPCNSRFYKPACIPKAQRVKGTDAGKNEKQGHDPLTQKQNKKRYHYITLGIFHVPALIVKIPGTMK
jgi:hypothetical protein